MRCIRVCWAQHTWRRWGARGTKRPRVRDKWGTRTRNTWGTWGFRVRKERGVSGTRVHVQQRVISMCQWFLLFNIWSIFKLIFIHGKITISFIYRAFLEKIPTAIYCFKVNNGNMKTICKTCSNITMKTLEKRQ